MERHRDQGARDVVPPDRTSVGLHPHADPQRAGPVVVEASGSLGGTGPVAQAARHLLQLPRVFLSVVERSRVTAAEIDLERRARAVVVEDAQRRLGTRRGDEGGASSPVSRDEGRRV